MNFCTKKTQLIILGISSLAISRGMFALFNDPEGPNLLIVVVFAAILFSMSLLSYLSNFSYNNKFLLALFIQIIIAIVPPLLLN